MALREALKSRWFWYSILCVLCWGAWALLSITLLQAAGVLCALTAVVLLST
jgi:hypothetical protein